MFAVIANYLREFVESVGNGWNRFWFVRRDPLALSVMRICVGLLALYAHLTYTPDLARFFGADGLLPMSAVEELRGSDRFGPTYLEFFTTRGELWGAHAAGAVVLLLFTAGVFTRVTSVLALVVVLSYVHRGPMLTSQFEPILTMFMCYLCLVPSGAYLSVDRRLALARDARRTAYERATHPLRTESVLANIATRLMQIHLSAIYFVMALAKLSGSDVWWTGTAMWWIVTKPESRAVDFTPLLHSHPYWVDAWTHAVILYELAFAILIWNRQLRPLILALGVPMWGLLALATGHFPFCLMMLVASLCFVSPSVMRLMLGGGSDRVSRAQPVDAEASSSVAPEKRGTSVHGRPHSSGATSILRK